MKEKELQETNIIEKKLPDTKVRSKRIPGKIIEDKKLPIVGKPENTIVIGDKTIEIKPTKLKYHRSNVASFYKIVDTFALPDIMAMDANTFGDGRDGDKALMDWLIAVTDDEELIVKNYNSLDADIIEKMLTIFKRVNRIDEKEEKIKNAESRMEKV